MTVDSLNHQAEAIGQRVNFELINAYDVGDEPEEEDDEILVGDQDDILIVEGEEEEESEKVGKAKAPKAKTGAHKKEKSTARKSA